MENDKAKFQAARELIEVGQYEEAKEILRRINSPTAIVWIKKIDDRIQHRKEVEQLKLQAVRKTQIKKSLTFGNLFMVIILWGFSLIGLIGAIGFLTAFALPPPSYIIEGSSHDDRNRILQLLMFLAFTFVAIFGFQLGWKRVSGKTVRRRK